MAEEPQSFWRCDDDGETFVASTTVSAHGPDGEEVDAPVGVDVVLGLLPCPICGRPMRRVVSDADGRDWGEQF